MADQKYILVCGGAGCKADEVVQALTDEAAKQGVAEGVQIVKTGCFGFCEQGPIVKILPGEAFYVNLGPADAGEIVAETIIGETNNRTSSPP